MGKQYKQLTLDERYQIQALVQLDFSARKIAVELGRSNRTISNELTRTKNSTYSAQLAHAIALDKRKTALKFSKMTEDIIDKIDSLLKVDFSPEQIAGRMKKESIEGRVSTQTIYRLVGLKKWRKRLARKGKVYRMRSGSTAGAKLIPNRVDIDERPNDVDLKEKVGHWEADTVHGADGYFVTLAERKTKLFLFIRVKRKTKKAVTRAIIKMLKPYKKQCDSITFDNGGEFAGHDKIAKSLKCRTYFAKPYHSWQRGLNENSNGLLRRYFPKKTAIAKISQQVLMQIQILINMRPRKTLGYESPLEAMTGKRVSLIA